MALQQLKEPEKILAKILLYEIGAWEEKYKENLIKDRPLLSEREIDDRVIDASARKFRNQFSKVLKIKTISLVSTEKLTHFSTY